MEKGKMGNRGYKQGEMSPSVEDYHHFGFCKDPMGNWIPNLNWEDKKLEEKKVKIERSNLFFT